MSCQLSFISTNNEPGTDARGKGSRGVDELFRQPKIALRCTDTEELEILAAKARSLNLCARTIQDA